MLIVCSLRMSAGMPMLLVMEYVENGCLRKYLRARSKELDSRTLLRFAQEVAEVRSLMCLGTSVPIPLIGLGLLVV